MKRRTLISGLAALSVLGVARPSVAAFRTTICLVPHPDDGVIRLSHYAVIASDRGDHMILAAATDGEATSVGPRKGLTRSQTARLRRMEQENAWNMLTAGTGEIVRLDQPDGGARWQDIYAALSPMIVGDTEVYVATWHHDRKGSVIEDKHRDHIACVEAARRLQRDGVTVRYAIHPSSKARGVTYRARNSYQRLRVEGAVAAFTPVGHRSTDSLDLVVGGSTRVTS